jgi:DNA-binding MarR family transcriptional regulator
MADDPRATRPAHAEPHHSLEDIAVERALEGLFRMVGNRRFDARQSATIGAVVTRAGYALLRSLSDHGPLGLRALADVSYMDAATASRQVNQLVDEELVRRQADANDARAVVLSLTDLGRDVYERVVAYRLDHLAKVLTDWTDEDRGLLAVLVNRLAADLGDTEIAAAIDTSAFDREGR